MTPAQKNMFQLGHMDGYAQRSFDPPRDSKLKKYYFRGYDKGEQDIMDDYLIDVDPRYPIED